MAGPIAAFVQLPLDTGNTGKKMRTQSRVVGADTVHEHFYVAVNPRDIVGRYFWSSGILSARTAADNGTATGNFWFHVPVGAAIRTRIARISMSIWNLTHAAAQTTATRLALALFTFTGVASGGVVTPAKHESTDAAAVASLRTAVTGLTVSVGAIVTSEPYHIVIGTTGVGAGPIHKVPTWHRDQDYDSDSIILRPGEGLLCYQPDTSTTTNPRAIVNMSTEEYNP